MALVELECAVIVVAQQHGDKQIKDIGYRSVEHGVAQLDDVFFIGTVQHSICVFGDWGLAVACDADNKMVFFFADCAAHGTCIRLFPCVK